MDERSITGLVNELHARLENAKTISDKDRELLTQLSADVQAALAHSGGGAATRHRPVFDRLEKAIAHFEVSHPDLTDVMARMSKMLADMGI